MEVDTYPREEKPDRDWRKLQIGELFYTEWPYEISQLGEVWSKRSRVIIKGEKYGRRHRYTLWNGIEHLKIRQDELIKMHERLDPAEEEEAAATPLPPSHTLRGESLEHWRDIPGWPGYLACHDGRIFSRRRGRVMRPSNAGQRSETITLCRGKVMERLTVGELVCAAWHGPCPEGYELKRLPPGMKDLFDDGRWQWTNSADRLAWAPNPFPAGWREKLLEEISFQEGALPPSTPRRVERKRD